MINTMTDYGVDFGAPGGLAQWYRMTDARDERITSAAHYVAACVRLAGRGSISGVCRVGDEDGKVRLWLSREPYDFDRHGHLAGRGIDGRLVAVGWNHETPRAWLSGGLQRFLKYWILSSSRPAMAGSPYNVDPDHAYAAMRAGIPPLAAGFWRPGIARQRAVRRARAARRSSVYQCAGHPVGVTDGALEQLGRLSPELQRALLHVSGYRQEVYGPLAPARPDGSRPVIGCRDLRWDLVAPIARAMAADKSGRVRAAWATGRRQKELARAAGCPSGPWWEGPDNPLDGALATWLCPAYPWIRVQVAARICRGESPVDIADGQLTRAEAHKWLSETPGYVRTRDGAEGVTPIEWLQRRLPADVPPMRDIAVVRWLLDVQRRGSWAQLTRERTAHGPAGAEATYTYLSRVDEIMGEDLLRGNATRVEDAFRAAAERCGEAWLTALEDDHRVLAPATGWPLYRKAMRELRTPAALVAEGRALQHCVGSYTSAVEAQTVVILGLAVAGQRSTVEIDRRTGRVLQHRGSRNGEPAPVLERLLSKFLQRARLGVGGA